MNKVIKSVLLLSIILSLQNFFSCSKNEEIIDLDADYLTVTDVMEYCKRECHEELDLIGESVKVKGYIKQRTYDTNFYYVELNRLLFNLEDFRNKKDIRIQIMSDSINIMKKLEKVSYNEVVYLNGKVSYGFDLPTNNLCYMDLFIELFNADDIKIN